MMDYIIGKNPVIEALKAGRDIHKIWIAEGAQRHAVEPVLEWAKRRGGSSNMSRSASLIRWLKELIKG